MSINVVIPTYVGILTSKNSFILDLSIHFLYMEGNIVKNDLEEILNPVKPQEVLGALAIRKNCLNMEGNITHYLIYIFSKSVLPLERM